jgi:hypothetical protein
MEPEHGRGAGLAEAQAGNTLAVMEAGQHDRLEDSSIRKLRLPLAERGQEPGVDIAADQSQGSPVVCRNILWTRG